MITYEQIPDFYDWLSRYVQVANWLAHRDRFAGFAMHKTLAAPDRMRLRRDDLSLAGAGGRHLRRAHAQPRAARRRPPGGAAASTGGRLPVPPP